MSTWHGVLPNTWRAVKLKRLVRNIVDQTNSRPDGDIYVALEHIESWTGRLTLPDETVPFDSSVKRFRTGDVLFGKLRPYLAKGIVATQPGVCVGELLVLRVSSPEIQNRFLLYGLLCKKFIEVVNSSTFGAKMPRADWEFVGNLTFPIPPISEQVMRLRLIDHKVHQIDRFIESKTRLVELFGEQKRAVTNRAVTKGLNPDAPLKQTGIHWLGDVPAHWEVTRIKHVLRPVDERSQTGDEPLLSMRMYHGLVRYDEHYDRDPQVTTLVGYKIVHPGQLVVNRMQAGNGLIFVSSIFGIVSPDYSVFDVAELALPEFVAIRFRSDSARTKFRQESKGLGTGTSGFLRLYDDRLAAIHVALPTRDEQASILEYLRVSIGRIDQAIATAKREVDLIKEFRSALISDVMTGNLEVREAAKRVEALAV